MFPLRDNIPSRSAPVAMLTLIGVNVLVFLYEVRLPAKALEATLQRYGVVPLRYYPLARLRAVGYRGEGFSVAEKGLPLFTHMFLHGGWAHLLSNMWFLWIFGDNVEDRMGHGRFLVFYLLCGLAACGAQVWAVWPQPQSPTSFQAAATPMVGASGAIAGVLGAYFLLYPYARVTTFVPVFFIPYFVELPAMLVLGLWFVVQWIQGTASLGLTATSGGVAWWAHIGGFVAGLALVSAFVRPQRRPTRPVVIWRD